MSRARKLAGFGSAIGQEQNPVNIQIGVMTATKLFGDGSELTGTPGGLGTALSLDLSSPLNKFYFTDQNLSIGATITVDPPASARVAYTQYANILMSGDADLIVGDDDDVIVDILGISTLADAPGILQNGSGRIRVDNITDKQGFSSPAFPYGLTVNAGAAATFSGTAEFGGAVTLSSASASGAITGTGSTAAPFISRTGDTDTGLYYPANGVIAISNDGNESLRISQSSNYPIVAIGTDNPTTSVLGLQIYRQSAANILLTSNTSVSQAIFRSNTGNTDKKIIAVRNTIDTGESNLIIGTQNDSYGSFSEKLRITHGGEVRVATGSTLQLGTQSYSNNVIYNYENVAGGGIGRYYVSDNLNAGEKTRFNFTGTNRKGCMITINAVGSWAASNTGNNHPAAQFMVRVFTNSAGTAADSSTLTLPFAYVYDATNYTFTNNGGFSYSIDIQNPTADDGVIFTYEVIINNARIDSKHVLVSSTTVS